MKTFIVVTTKYAEPRKFFGFEVTSDYAVFDSPVDAQIFIDGEYAVNALDDFCRLNKPNGEVINKVFCILAESIPDAYRRACGLKCR